ncbi:Fc.00g034810.m01.CDS01 [Cosmosporella sp. VM-42]
MTTPMEQYVMDNIARYQKLVSQYKAPRVRRTGNEGTVSPDMVVATRLRPLLDDETEVGLPAAIFPRAEQPGVLDVHELRQPVRGPALLRSFNFQVDRIYNSESATEQIYDDVVKPLVPWAWSGGIATLFAYGQTGSGKTFTVSRLESLVAEELMDGTLEGERKVYITIIELAGNAAHDLLNTRRPVSILEDSFGITQLTGALEQEVTSAEEMLGLIDTATTFRKTEATKKNDTSSRSHAICRIRIQNPSMPAAEDGVLYLIDLAGSEAARDLATHGAQRMRETREINASLSVLKDCIRGKAEADALAASNSKKKPHVPFRQSTLTKILKHVFDPSGMRTCKTVVVGCVNPCLLDAGPSKNTLRYAETLRVLVPEAKPMRFDLNSPLTWTNQQLKEWVEKNSGSPPVSGAMLAPSESGTQILRLPAPEFEKRCLKTEGVSFEQAKAFRSKLWQMHVDSQRAKAMKTTAAAGPTDLENGETQLDRSSSKDPDLKAIAFPFKEHIRPGMAVSWTPPAGFPMTLSGINMVVILSPASAVGEDVKDALGTKVKPAEGDESGRRKYLCAMVTPAVMSEAYDVHLWRQVVVDVESMDAEVILEYDVATRYYYIAI